MDTTAMYFLIGPDRVLKLDEEGRPTQVWYESDLFDVLVLSGCPLYRDEDGDTYIDLTVVGDCIEVNTNDTDDSTQVGIPMEPGLRDAFDQWRLAH